MGVGEGLKIAYHKTFGHFYVNQQQLISKLGTCTKTPIIAIFRATG